MEELNCRLVRSSLGDYVSNELGASARASIESHLRECRECDLHRLESASLRSGLRHLPLRQPPALLRTRLKVVASRERSRVVSGQRLPFWVRDKAWRVRLFFDHLLRPFAVPAAGGLCASFICFGLLIDNLQLRPVWEGMVWNGTVPRELSTEAAIAEVSPFCTSQGDVMVQLTVDESGHVTDYAAPQGVFTPAELQEIGNLVLYSTFTPATRFGRPISSRFLFRMSHVSVKG